MQRRGFLGAMLAAAAAPAIVRAESLMPIWVPPQRIVFLGDIGELRVTRGVCRYGGQAAMPAQGDWTVEGWLRPAGEGGHDSVVLMYSGNGVKRYLNGHLVRFFPPKHRLGVDEMRSLALPHLGLISA